ncbi:MAG: hypothetical protein V1799_07445 [bacterium]
MIRRATRGLMSNPNAGLMLKFQFNPHELLVSKKPEYELQTPAGWDHPIAWYSHGGERYIEFQLWGDSTQGAVNVEAANIVKPFGVMDMISTIESFMLPESGMFSLPNKKTKRFVDPPDCYFIYGLQWAKTKVVEAPIKQMLFDPDTLLPNRFSTNIKLLVIEEGSISNYSSAQRLVMSRFSGVTSAVGTIAGRF